MNKLLSYLTIMIVFMGVILTSCGKEDEPNGGKYDDPSVPTEFTPNEESISYFTDGLVFSAEGGSVEINFTTNKMWSTNLSYTDGGRDWLSISQNQTQGQVVLTASTNATPTPRTAVLTIAAGGNNNYIKITQNSTSTVVLHVETAGTLDKLLPANGRDQITSLTLSGYLNGSDIKVVRSLFRWGSDNHLDYLNLENATIVSGGGSYAPEYDVSAYYDCKTKDNVIGMLMFAYFWGKTLLLPSNTKGISYQAIFNCPNLTELVLPDNLEWIQNNGLQIIAVRELTIPKKVVAIPAPNLSDSKEFNLSALNNLERLVVESELIGSSLVLTQCNNLEEVILNCNAVYVYNLPKLSKVTLNQGVTKIDGIAFSECPSLKSLTIPSSVNMIGNIAMTSDSQKVGNYVCTIPEIHLEMTTIPWEKGGWYDSGYKIYPQAFRNTTLYIPRGSMANYAPIKECFKSIIEE